MESIKVEGRIVGAVVYQSCLLECLVQGLGGRYHGILVAWRVFGDDEGGPGHDRGNRLSMNFGTTKLAGMG